MKPTAIKNTKKKKKHAARSCRHNKVILADRNTNWPKSIFTITIISQALSSHTPTLQIYIIIHNQFSIDPNQFTHQHFKSISSSTINLQILTKKKQIKVPTTATATRHRVSCDRDEGERQRWAWESELRSGLSCDGNEGER